MLSVVDRDRLWRVSLASKQTKRHTVVDTEYQMSSCCSEWKHWSFCLEVCIPPWLAHLQRPSGGSCGLCSCPPFMGHCLAVDDLCSSKTLDVENEVWAVPLLCLCVCLCLLGTAQSGQAAAGAQPIMLCWGPSGDRQPWLQSPHAPRSAPGTRLQCSLLYRWWW